MYWPSIEGLTWFSPGASDALHKSSVFQFGDHAVIYSAESDRSIVPRGGCLTKREQARAVSLSVSLESCESRVSGAAIVRGRTQFGSRFSAAGESLNVIGIHMCESPGAFGVGPCCQQVAAMQLGAARRIRR